MPRWLHDQLAAGPKITVVNRIGRDGRLIKQEQLQNETAGVIPILAQLSALDRTVKEAYYCHPSTLHVGKTPKEGSFCGYRNIQMLVSYIQGAKGQGHEEFPGRLPGILKLQELIERAWDKGINHIGRIQTGGIKDTRKYIGTPEVCRSLHQKGSVMLTPSRHRLSFSAARSTARSRCSATKTPHTARYRPMICFFLRSNATSLRLPSVTDQLCTRPSCHPYTSSDQVILSPSLVLNVAVTATATS